MRYGSRNREFGSRRNGRVVSSRRPANGRGFPRQRLQSRDASFSSRGSRMRLRSSMDWETERLIEFADRYGDDRYRRMDDSNHFEIWIGEGWAVTYADAFREKTPGQWLAYLFDQEDQLWECCGDYGCEDMFMRYYLHFDPRDDDPSNAWDDYAGMEYGAKNESLYIADKDPLIELEAVAILLSMKEGVSNPEEAFEALKALDKDCRVMGYV